MNDTTEAEPRKAARPLEKGDYVVACKYSDGDPQDGWCVGFLDRTEDTPMWGIRHFVVDEDGMSFRHNGWRAARRISTARGKFLLDNMKWIQHGSLSVWHFLRVKMDGLTDAP